MPQGSASVGEALDLELAGDPPRDEGDDRDSSPKPLRGAAPESVCRRPGVEAAMVGAQPALPSGVTGPRGSEAMSQGFRDHRGLPARRHHPYQQILVDGALRRVDVKATDLTPCGRAEHVASRLSRACCESGSAEQPEFSVLARCPRLAEDDDTRARGRLQGPGRLFDCRRFEGIARGKLHDAPAAGHGDRGITRRGRHRAADWQDLHLGERLADEALDRLPE